jgi:diguanylate cyclase (GGDEF)-like protein
MPPGQGGGFQFHFAAVPMFSTSLKARHPGQPHRLARGAGSYRPHCSVSNYLMQPVYGKDGRIADCAVLDCNEQAASLYGKPKGQVIGSSLASHYHRDQFRSLMEVYELVLQLGTYDDEIHLPGCGSVDLEWVERRFRREGGCIRVTIEDVGAQRSHAGELMRLAYDDRLTGLPNRSWMMEALPIILAASGEEPVLLALLDLDRFSDLNDELGMARGDTVLHWLADRLTQSLPAGTVIARFGADEFAVVFRTRNGDAAGHFTAALQCALYDKPCPHAPAISAAIGISSYPNDATAAEALVAHAELALQSAKQSGKAALVRYVPRLSSRLQLGRDLENALHPAHAGEIYLEYQPRVSVRTGELVSMEALARWRHPLKGMVAPCEFIPLAEQRNLIVPLGRRIFELACRQLAAWRNERLPLVPISVNVSPHQLQHPALCEDLLDSMARHEITPELIELEITESAMVGEQPVVIEQIRQLRAVGFRLAMDDFGVGHSSLSQLKNLEMDVLKIDRSFTSDLSTTAHGQVFFNAIVLMAHALDMCVVAEGVETQEQLAVLRTLHCDEAQGDLLSRPVSSTQMARFMVQPQFYAPAAPSKRLSLVPGRLAVR